MSKQTAVDWLIQNIKEDQTIKAKSTSEWIKVFNQAKELEKEQIKNAFIQGDLFSSDYFDGVNMTEDNYYNETYKEDK